MVDQTAASSNPVEDERQRALTLYRKKLAECRELEERLKDLRKKVICCRICSTLVFRKLNSRKDLINRKMISSLYNRLDRLLVKCSSSLARKSLL